MKKILFVFIAIATVLLSSCGVGTYSVTSGNADESAICFVANEKYDITVYVDGTQYNTETIKQKTYKNKRNIKKTATKQIKLTPGRHSIKVVKDGMDLYSKEIFLSASDVKVIEL